jgi:hypothetical protein
MYYNMYPVLGAIVGIIAISTVTPIYAFPLSRSPFNINFNTQQFIQNLWERLCVNSYNDNNNPNCSVVTRTPPPISIPPITPPIPQLPLSSSSTSTSTSSQCVNDFCTTCINGVCSTTGGSPPIGQYSKSEQCINNTCTSCVNGVCSTSTVPNGHPIIVQDQNSANSANSANGLPGTNNNGGTGYAYWPGK